MRVKTWLPVLGAGCLFLTSLFHAISSPATKVEESFNAQAIHDVLYYGVGNIDKFDHTEFPGVVPRTFLGALAVSALAKPVQVAWTLATCPCKRDKAVMLLVSRAILAGLVTLGLYSFAGSWGKGDGAGSVPAIFFLICASQFHLPFYMSRALPNTFALGLSAWGLGYWVDAYGAGNNGRGATKDGRNGADVEGSRARKLTRAIFILTSVATIFRCDAIVLVGIVGIHLVFVSRDVGATRGIITGLVAAIVSVSITVAVDSYFWGRWLWPEGEVLYFNTVLNKSKEWGVSPPSWYFTSALPKMLQFSYPLSFVGAIFSRKARAMMSVAVGYTFVMSLLAHKETRFLFPTLPLWNMSSAAGLCYIFSSNFNVRRYLPLVVAATRAVCVLCLLGGLAVTVLSAKASYRNYPGEAGIKHLISHIQEHEVERMRAASKNDSLPISVHIDTLAATTGVSRFFQDDKRGAIIYSKEEGIGLAEFRAKGFDFLLNEHSEIPGYDVISGIQGFAGIRLDRVKMKRLVGALIDANISTVLRWGVSLPRRVGGMGWGDDGEEPGLLSLVPIAMEERESLFVLARSG